ncbi:MAG TPA: lipopolysaccharide kinase InaA family protein [Candidatus Binatia bacterium]|jgi:hypothetical protein|nr:lipopolysaccharide kinase InaA family protein [Candidatus Binatia bacterium]
MSEYARWNRDGWRGWRAAGEPLDEAASLAAAESGEGRTSRHARSLRLATPTGDVWVKAYPPPGARRARRAFVMGRALAAAGFVAPETLLVAWRRRAGVLVTRDTGGEDLLALVDRLGRDRDLRGAKRSLLARLGADVGRLHQAGFVHGDLVPPNVRVRDDGSLVFLDNDRTARGLLAVGARRNLVQLGRFVVPGLGLSDRARVLWAYAGICGLDRRARHRLGRWVARKITARRCAIDGIAAEDAARVGFRELMRSGGAFDPARRTEPDA